MRETAMRLAFIRAVHNVLNSPRAVEQPRLVKRIARLLDAGRGIKRGR